MLILTRQVNQRIRIGDDIVVEIVAINGQEVRVGIDAPKDVTILREELVQVSAPDVSEEETEAVCGM